MNIKQAKDLDMVEYLARLGHEPQKISGKDYWYHSPLHDEKTPSFKINRKMNRWYDFSIGKGGNLVDFGVLYHSCSVKDFLEKLDSPVIAVHKHNKTSAETADDEKDQIQITGVRPIISFPLRSYLKKRCIPESIADKYCQEVSYSLKGNNYYAIGFKNDAGGYELRNEYVKAASSPKDITFIDNGAKEVATFEGFFNFLSYKAMYHHQEEPQRNYLILNSTSFFEKALPKMLTHDRAHLYLDNDKTGQNCTLKALEMDSRKFIDERHLYKSYNDLNHWLTNNSQSQKHGHRQRP